MSKGRPPVQRSPREKKDLSYARDCRNTYGNNNKAARKAIPRNKALENRHDRRCADRDLQALLIADEAVADMKESSIRQDIYRIGGWTKGSDTPLAAFVDRQLDRRDAREGRKAWRADNPGAISHWGDGRELRMVRLLAAQKGRRIIIL